MIYVKFIVLSFQAKKRRFVRLPYKATKNNLKYFEPPLTNFRCDELQPSETKTQAKLSGISGENPAGFLRAQSYVIVNLLRLDWLFRFTANTKGEARSSNGSSRLWGGALRDDTKNGCVGDHWNG